MLGGFCLTGTSRDCETDHSYGSFDLFLNKTTVPIFFNCQIFFNPNEVSMIQMSKLNHALNAQTRVVCAFIGLVCSWGLMTVTKFIKFTYPLMHWYFKHNKVLFTSVWPFLDCTMWGKLPKAKWLKSQSKEVVQRGKDRLCTCGCQALKTLDTALRERAETNGAQPSQRNSAKLFSDCISCL